MAWFRSSGRVPQGRQTQPQGGEQIVELGLKDAGLQLGGQVPGQGTDDPRRHRGGGVLALHMHHALAEQTAEHPLPAGRELVQVVQIERSGVRRLARPGQGGFLLRGVGRAVEGHEGALEQGLALWMLWAKRDLPLPTSP